jgi:hypothetical protein
LDAELKNFEKFDDYDNLGFRACYEVPVEIEAKSSLPSHGGPVSQGADVMIFKTLSPKQLAENRRF